MNNVIKYEVVITSGRFVTDGMESKAIEFSHENIYEARENALNHVKEILRESSINEDVDDPSFVYDIPELIQNLDSMSVDVYFVNNESKEPIYGTEVHDVLTGLHTEALYYLKNNLVEKESLVKLLENRKEIQKDPDNPAYIFAKDATGFPDFDFDVINILPNYMEFILSSFAY